MVKTKEKSIERYTGIDIIGVFEDNYFILRENIGVLSPGLVSDKELEEIARQATKKDFCEHVGYDGSRVDICLANGPGEDPKIMMDKIHYILGDDIFRNINLVYGSEAEDNPALYEERRDNPDRITELHITAKNEDEAKRVFSAIDSCNLLRRDGDRAVYEGENSIKIELYGTGYDGAKAVRDRILSHFELRSEGIDAHIYKTKEERGDISNILGYDIGKERSN